MARRCASAAILETLRDPRVVTLPAAAQTLWIRIVTAMQNGEMSVLRFGSSIMNRTEIALFIQIAETEIETHLETLIDRGLLVRDAAGTVVCPMLAAAKTRADINRANGRLGGRPRKQPDPAGQTEMIMPISGGKMKTEITESETEPETENASGAARDTTYLLNKESSGGQSVVSEEAYHELGKKVLDLVGADPARSFLTYKPVRQWLANGADVALVVDVIGQVMSRPNPPRIVTLNYFDGPIAEAIKARPPKKPDWEKAWDRAYAIWDVSGRGVEPMPRLEDFKPREVA